MSFFDSLDRTKLKELLQVRVADGSLMRLIGKLLRVGVLDGEAYTTPDRGTAQGSGAVPAAGQRLSALRPRRVVRPGRAATLAGSGDAGEICR